MRKHKAIKKNLIIIWLEFIPFMIFWGIQRILSLHAAYRLNTFLLQLWFVIDRKHHRRTLQHLQHAGIAKNGSEARQIAQLNYSSLAKLAAEVFKFDQLIASGNIEDILQVEGSDEAFRLVSGDQGFIIVTAHYGNWEMAGTGYCLAFNKPIVSVMRPFNNPLIGKYILRSRESADHKSYEKRVAVKHMLRALHNNTAVAMLVDQHASSTEGVETRFFGQPARTHISPALLHLRTGAPIIVSVTRRMDDDFHFKSFLKGPIYYQPTGDRDKDLQAVTQLYTTALEELIKDEPEQWLWLHRRWLNINRHTKTSLDFEKQKNK